MLKTGFSTTFDEI